MPSPVLPGWPGVVPSSEPVGDERGEGLLGRVPPADAERVSGRVGVHLMAFVAVQVRSRLEQAGAEGDCLFVRGSGVIDVEVEMHLLRDAVWPLGRNVVRCQLYADPPLPIGIDNAVPCLILKDVAAEDPSPERAFGSQVGCVEHDHVTHQLHDAEATKCRRPRARTSTNSVR